jgi:hypothetical protein
MAKPEATTPIRRHPPHVRIWLNPATAPKIKQIGPTWMGHVLIHITHALNELPPAARGTFIKDLQDFLRRDAQAVARHERDRAAKRGRS